MPYNPNDHYFKKAKAENYAARSVYKLEEIDKKFGLLKRGNKVLDLGCAPGSWSQYASKVVDREGKVVGIDLTPVRIQLTNGFLLKADIYDPELPTILASVGVNPPFDAIISDMAPATTGSRFTDQVRSFELCMAALGLCAKYLKPKGNFVCKFFDGPDFQELRTALRANFEKVDTLRPKSTRQESKELFFIAMGYKGAAETAEEPPVA